MPDQAVASNVAFPFAYLQEPPFCFTTAGSVGGCDVEVARYVVEALHLGSFEPIEASFVELLPGLAQGRWQITTGLFVTEARRRIVRFSRPIWALHDGLMVAAGNAKGISGYRSLGADPSARLAVIAGQVQHETALALGMPPARIAVFDTQEEAAQAVGCGEVDAYASVAAAHRGYLGLNRSAMLEIVDVPPEEKAAEYGAFAFSGAAGRLCGAVDEVLADYLGAPVHRTLMRGYGFTDDEIDKVAG